MLRLPFGLEIKPIFNYKLIEILAETFIQKRKKKRMMTPETKMRFMKNKEAVSLSFATNNGRLAFSRCACGLHGAQQLVIFKEKVHCYHPTHTSSAQHVSFPKPLHSHGQLLQVGPIPAHPRALLLRALHSPSDALSAVDLCQRIRFIA